MQMPIDAYSKWYAGHLHFLQTMQVDGLIKALARKLSAPHIFREVAGWTSALCQVVDM